MSHQADPELRPKLPVYLHVNGEQNSSNSLWLLTAIACEPWNAIRACFQLVESSKEADAFVDWSDRTWVRMQGACVDGQKPTVYLQRSPIGIQTVGDWKRAIEGWMPHELGHLLGFADHVRESTDISKGYRSPFVEAGVEHPGTLSGYHGVMSYLCNRFEWFKADDQAALAEFESKEGW